MSKNRGIAFGIIFIAIIVFFAPFIFGGKLPVPSDTIIGLYHPFRDLYAKQYPNGIPFKNYLITDPVRQQYPWKYTAIENISHFHLPLWNPYNFSGTPLLANMQSAAFYPANILFFLFSFPIAWSILILSQPLFAAIFLYIYLRNLRLGRAASLLGGVSFAFSGFFIAWLEWGTILHVALWLPLILYCIDGIFIYESLKHFDKFRNKIITNAILLFLSICFAFLAGHLQTFFYLMLFVIAYIFARFIQYKKNISFLKPFFIVGLCFLIVTSVQWYSTLQLILQSARDIDQADWTKAGWFIPWQHGIQFLVPDFFGNPASLNYWSDWNYAEFVGYIGLIPFILSIYALFFRRDKKTLFFGTILFISLLFAFPTPLAKLPFELSIPFISTAQPTRLLFLIDFTLAILAAFGMDYFARRTREMKYPLFGIGICFLLLWAVLLFGSSHFSQVTVENISIAKRNMVLPSIIFILSVLVLASGMLFGRRKYMLVTVTYLLVGVTLFDLLRFGMKFTPFTSKEYLFPQTLSLRFLQKQQPPFRIMTTDSQILPPNFSSMYHIQSVDGYDPIYLRRYAEMIAASERGEPDITPPFGFNRIITPHNYDSPIMDILNVRFVLSLSDISSPKLRKVFQEGKTQVYENKKVLPRAFFVSSVEKKENIQDVIESLMDKNTNLQNIAFTDDNLFHAEEKEYTKGSVKILQYNDNSIVLQTKNTGEGFLVISEIYYPIWRAALYKNNTFVRRLNILQTDYVLRGITIPKGEYTVRLYANLF